jgi:hypothetical protein
MMDDKIKERMLKDFNLQKSQVGESPRQKAHREMVNDPNKLGHVITIKMNQMIKNGKVPTWENYCSTADWAVIAMNLDEDGKFKFGNKWREVYGQLIKQGGTNEDETEEDSGISNRIPSEGSDDV